MKSPAGEASAAAAAASAWAENLGGGAGSGDHARPGRQTCWAAWREDLAAFEVLQPRGDYLRSMGTTWRGRTMLHAEEGLWLVERGMLAVHPFSGSSKSHQAAAATPGPATGDTNKVGGRRANPCSSRPETARGPGELRQGGGEREKEDSTAHEDAGASVGRSTGGRKREQKEEEEEREEKKEKIRPREVDRSDGSSATKTGPPPPPPSSAAVEEGPSKAGRPPVRGFSGNPPVEEEPGQVLGSREKSGRLARGERGHGHRERGGRRRGRSGSSPGSERDGGVAPAPPMSVEDLHGLVLPRAGVPWECYRAYAELKRRSYVVRRQPEDTVGYDDARPRAAALSWFGRAPRAAGRSPQTVTRETDNGSLTGTDLNSSTTTTTTTTTTSSSSCFPPPSAGPPPLPVTFHVYNRPPGSSSSSSSSSSFRKRDPPPPDALLAVCRFGDLMPEHGSLVALAERHADMKKDASTSTGTGTGVGKPAERRRRQEGRTGAGGRGSGVGQAQPGRGARGREWTAEEEEEKESGGRGAGGASRAEAEPKRKGVALSGQRRGKRPGDVENARNLAQSGGGGGGGGAESGLGVSVPGTARGRSERLSLDEQQYGGLAASRPQAEEVVSRRLSDDDTGGGGEGHGAGKGGDGTGVSAAAERRAPPPPGAIKLAVVSWEAGVQLFDVGLHDASEVNHEQLN